MGMLEGSIEQDGWIGAITTAADGETFDGSARVEVTARMGMLDDPIVIDSDGTRPIVVRRTDIPTADDPRAKRLGLGANWIAAKNLEWEPDVLAELAKDVDVSGLFYPDELADLSMPALPEPGAGGDEFDATPDDGPTRAQLGDIFALGEHRLLCGDSTNRDQVQALMNGKRAGAVVTDSPYGIDREGIANDDEVGLRGLFDGCLRCLPCDNAVVINFQSPRLFPIWIDATRAAGHKFERALWFYDETDVTYPWRGWLMTSQIALVTSLGKPKWNDSGPYHHDCYLVKTAGMQDDSGGHTTAKPLDVVQDLVAHTTGLVYEPFMGSGTTLIAAERLGRVCYGVELQPKYCDVILRRWEAETGQEARLERRLFD